MRSVTCSRGKASDDTAFGCATPGAVRTKGHRNDFDAAGKTCASKTRTSRKLAVIPSEPSSPRTAKAASGGSFMAGVRAMFQWTAA